MKLKPRIATGAVLLATVAPMAVFAQAAPVIEVVFEKPETFRDAIPRGWAGSAEELKETLDGVQRIFATQAARHLKPGDQLKVTVTDIDLAGEVEPHRRGRWDVRVLRGITWPSMAVRYTFKRDGKETSAVETIADMSYQDQLGWCSSQGAFCYESRMIARWMQRQFE